MLKRVDQWIYTADKNIEVFSKFGRPKHLVKIDNGFEPTPTARLTREALGLRSDSLVLLLASRAIQEKGWREAIETTRRLNLMGQPVDLMLVGDGPVADRLRADGVPANVRLYGQVPNLQDYIAICDVGLLPSYFLGESMPLVLIEMLAQGKPIVASNAGEIADMLTLHGQTAGVAVPLKGNRILVKDLVKAVSTLLSAASRTEKGMIASQIFRARFTMSAMLGAYSDLYRHHIDQRAVSLDTADGVA
jgi:glycosyltransferase involved in cell wall biosynthesis